VLDRRGAPVDDPSGILRGLRGIVLLDGTWSQAKTLWWRNPWLLRLHRIVLDPPLPARLGRLRREPRREALSTIEAAALALRHLESGPQAADALIAALDGMIAGAMSRKRANP
jgi:DTW domain-containing protein YfiP